MLNDCDIIMCSETWLTTTRKNNILIEGYTNICVCRKQSNRRAKRGSGGILIFIKDRFKDCIEVISNQSKSDDRVWLQLHRNVLGTKEDIFICCLYVSPIRSTHIASRESIRNLLEEEIATYSNYGLSRRL